MYDFKASIGKQPEKQVSFDHVSTWRQSVRKSKFTDFQYKIGTKTDIRDQMTIKHKKFRTMVDQIMEDKEVREVSGPGTRKSVRIRNSVVDVTDLRTSIILQQYDKITAEKKRRYSITLHKGE